MSAKFVTLRKSGTPTTRVDFAAASNTFGPSMRCRLWIFSPEWPMETRVFAWRLSLLAVPL